MVDKEIGEVEKVELLARTGPIQVPANVGYVLLGNGLKKQ